MYNNKEKSVIKKKIKKWTWNLTRQFSKEVRQMVKNMKRFSISLAFREMQIKTTVKYHFIYTRMTVIQKTDNDRYWWGYEEIGTLLLVGM